MRVLVLLAVAVQILCAQTRVDIRQAVTRALPLLERYAASFVAQRACVSCHHNILTVLALHLAAARGIPIDKGTLKAVEEKTFRQLDGSRALDDAVEAATLSDPTPDDSFLLMAAHAAGRERDRLLPSVPSGYRARSATATGSPPISGRRIRAAFSQHPPARFARFASTCPEKCVRKAMPRCCALASGSARHSPSRTEDASFRLLGLVWAGAPRLEIEQAQRDLLARQQAAGG